MIDAEAIDDAVVSADSRGMRTLRALLAAARIQHGCISAAETILRAPDPILVCTGFPVAGHPETDGPPGAVSVADALLALGRDVVLCSWNEALSLFDGQCQGARRVVIERGAPAMPMVGAAITIEICGAGPDGVYRNMRGADISSTVPRFEDVIGLEALVSVGDGGNEYGMGSAPESFFSQVKPPFPRPASRCDVLVPATVSNWGAYGVVAALSMRASRWLLPDPDAHVRLIEEMVKRGAVCGFTGMPEPFVDGLDLAQTLEVLVHLERIVRSAGLEPPTR